MTYLDQDFVRYTYSYWNSHPEEHESIVQEHMARIKQGVDIWNAFDRTFATYLKGFTPTLLMLCKNQHLIGKTALF